jgi:signal transduction histidine kinase/DNA-binding response OmpR family regulator
LKQTLQYLQNTDAVAFAMLGVATAVGWARRRDSSMGFLALAIVLLSTVTLAGRIPAAYAPPLLPELTLVAFVGSGYALLRFRGSLIPLRPRWHAAAAVALVLAVAGYFMTQALAAQHLVSAGVQTGAALVLILVWMATIVEPIVRFWVVARHLPAVQAWRLRSLTFGFGCLVAVLIFAIAVGAFASNELVQLVIQLCILLIVPLLYVSFSPPAWLRRQWRSSEEAGLRAFMEEQLLGENPDTLAERALEWAMRLVGGAAAVAFDGTGARLGSRGLNPEQMNSLERAVAELDEGVSRSVIDGVVKTVIVLPITGTGPEGRLVILAGPFTPRFGGDELSRVQQFMTAVAAAIDRGRLLEQLKKTNAELTNANRHKSLFLANMSHELRTPLNAILGFSELLIDAGNGRFPDATKKRFLQQIHSSGTHLLGLINDILDLSKVEAGQMELRLQSVAVADLVSQVTSSVEPLAVEKHQVLKSEATTSGQVVADLVKLRQMILNLVSNAIKFTPEGGAVTILASRVGDRLEISVSDTGIGIAEQDIGRIFKEFQQLDSGVNRRQQGTGLGLALTKSYAILHGGDVRVESELGKGSRFTIDIPLEPPSSRPVLRAGTPIDDEPSRRDTRPLIIVVEDDPASAELLTRQIGRGGFRTKIACTGAEAVAMAKALKPAAITLDILLPDLDGWEVLTRLKGDEATSDIPVIVVSVVDNPELGTALGALDYFVKPVGAKELVDRLSAFNFKHQSGGRQTSVLVVDDEASNRDLLKEVLEPAGFRVIIANGGKEAIELARSSKPDIVMLDLLMPEVNGFDVVEALSKAEATKGIPIIVLTAKHLSEADLVLLRGHVSTILRRGSTGSVDLLGQVQAVLKKRLVEV